MRLAVVGWGGDSGVGRELISAVQNLPVECGFILENQVKGTRKDLLKGTPCFFARGDRGTLVRQMELFIEAHRPDTVLTWEVPGDWKFSEVWRANKIAWNHVVHWDWFDGSKQHIWRMANLIAPNRMCQALLKGQYNLNAQHLPVPIDTNRFKFRLRTAAKRFVSVYGYGGAHERRSLWELVSAWDATPNVPPLTILAQAFPAELKVRKCPPNVNVSVANLPEPEDLYTNADVAVQPSRYEGVGVSLLEAQACGVPVIAVDAPPMKEIVPSLRVPVERVVKISIMGKHVDSHVPSVKGLSQVIQKIAGQDISGLSEAARKNVEKNFSWDALRAKWIYTLERSKGRR